MRNMLVLWLVGWALFGFPWSTFTLRPDLYRVSIVPFRRTRRRDQFLNFIYYIPLGVIGVLMGWAPGAVAALAASLSGLTEVVQIFSIDRIPSTTDFLLNTAGAVLGISVIIVLRAHSRSAV